MFGVGSSSALATCETSRVLLSGEPGVFLAEFSRFRTPTDLPVSYLERDVKLNLTRKLYHVICNMLYGAVHRSLRAKIRQYWD